VALSLVTGHWTGVGFDFYEFRICRFHSGIKRTTERALKRRRDTVGMVGAVAKRPVGVDLVVVAVNAHSFALVLRCDHRHRRTQEPGLMPGDLAVDPDIVSKDCRRRCDDGAGVLFNGLAA